MSDTINATNPADKNAFYDVGESFAQRLEKDPNLLHIITMAGRPGGYMFMRGMELKFFRPGSRDNDNFHLLLRRWEQIQWTVLSTPIRFRELVARFADECGMRLADGIPTVVDGSGIQYFPFNSKSAFTLENKKDSIVYEGAASRQRAVDLEFARVKEIERDHYRWFDQQNEIYWRGRVWKRLDDPRPPAGAIDMTIMGEHRGRASYWYTNDRRKPDGWAAYPA